MTKAEKIAFWMGAAFIASNIGVANGAVLMTNQAAGINNASTMEGNHFHTDPGSVVGVNSYNAEQGRGVAEFDIAGYAVGKATLSFSVLEFADSFTGGVPFAFPIQVSAYLGNNLAEISDYSVPTFALVGTIAPGHQIGETISFDVSEAYAYASNSGKSLGFLFNGETYQEGYASIRFNDLRLTVAEPGTIPEPGSLALLGLGLAGIAAARRRKQA